MEVRTMYSECPVLESVNFSTSLHLLLTDWGIFQFCDDLPVGWFLLQLCPHLHPEIIRDVNSGPGDQQLCWSLVTGLVYWC